MDSKQVLLEKSRVAREERAWARKQDRAILIVQSVVRRYLVRCRLTNHSLALLTETLNSTSVESKDCLLAIERFLITHHLKGAKINNFQVYTCYVTSICKYIGTSIMMGKSAKYCYVGLVLQKDYIKLWTSQVHSLIRLSLRHCECLDICQSAHKVRTHSLLEFFLCCFCLLLTDLFSEFCEHMLRIFLFSALMYYFLLIYGRKIIHSIRAFLTYTCRLKLSDGSKFEIFSSPNYSKFAA